MIGESFFDWLSEYETATYKQYVKSHEYDTFRNKTTTVILILNSGFEVVGVAGCEDPMNFDENLGHKFALKDALRKLGEFAAFHRAELKQTFGKLEEVKPLVAPPLTTDQIEELRQLWKQDAAVEVNRIIVEREQFIQRIATTGMRPDVVPCRTADEWENMTETIASEDAIPRHTRRP